MRNEIHKLRTQPFVFNKQKVRPSPLTQTSHHPIYQYMSIVPATCECCPCGCDAGHTDNAYMNQCSFSPFKSYLGLFHSNICPHQPLPVCDDGVGASNPVCALHEWSVVQQGSDRLRDVPDTAPRAKQDREHSQKLAQEGIHVDNVCMYPCLSQSLFASLTSLAFLLSVVCLDTNLHAYTGNTTRKFLQGSRWRR